MRRQFNPIYRAALGLTFLAAFFLVLFSAAPVARAQPIAQAACTALNFDALPAGTILTQQGDVTFAVLQGAAGKVILYPTSAPDNASWPETDLNRINVGNVIIFPEAVTDSNGDGLADPTGDHAAGGELEITFGAPRLIRTLTLGDDETGGKATVELYGADGLLTTFTSPKTGDATAHLQAVDTAGVTRLIWNTSTSTNLTFTSECWAGPVPSDTPALPTNTPNVPGTTTPTQSRTRTRTKTPISTNTPVLINTPTRTRRATRTMTPTPTNTSMGTSIPTRTSTVTRTNTPTRTSTPLRTNTPTQTNTPMRTNTPTRTSTPMRTNTPTVVQPTDTATVVPTDTSFADSNFEPALKFLNDIRQASGLAPVTVDATISDGATKHANYLVANAAYVEQTGSYHSEDPSKPFYTPEGEAVAGNSDIDPTCFLSWDAPIKNWLNGPLHAIPLLSPDLVSVGFGQKVQFANGFCNAAYVLGFKFRWPPALEQTVYYPPNGGTHQFLRYDGAEGDAPYEFCSGTFTGPAVFLKDALVIRPSDVTEHLFSEGDTAVGTDNCLGVFFDMIYVMPRNTLVSGKKYSVSITTLRGTHEWSFTAP